jgi:hypothetical protein
LPWLMQKGNALLMVPILRHINEGKFDEPLDLAKRWLHRRREGLNQPEPQIALGGSTIFKTPWLRLGRFSLGLR